VTCLRTRLPNSFVLCDCLSVAMTDQDKLEAVVDLGDEVILLYKDPAQKQPEDNASFTEIKDFESLRFQRTDGPYVLWPAKDGMGSYTKGLIMPDCLKQGWRLEVEVQLVHSRSLYKPILQFNLEW